MNIQSLLGESSNIMVSVTPSDLREFALAVVAEYRATEEQQPKEDKRFSQSEAAKFLGKSLATLWRWQKIGYLIPDGRVGLQPYYLQSTLENLGKEGKA